MGLKKVSVPRKVLKLAKTRIDGRKPKKFKNCEKMINAKISICLVLIGSIIGMALGDTRREVARQYRKRMNSDELLIEKLYFWISKFSDFDQYTNVKKKTPEQEIADAIDMGSGPGHWNCHWYLIDCWVRDTKQGLQIPSKARETLRRCCDFKVNGGRCKEMRLCKAL